MSQRRNTPLAFPSWVPYAVVLLVGVAAYARTIGFAFTTLDDDVLIVNRAAWLSTPSSIVKAFTKGYWYFTGYEFDVNYYRPLVTASFAIDALTGHGAPATYHLTNVVIHCTVAALFFAFLRQRGIASGVSLFMASAAAAHPLASNAVGWIPGRNDSLMAMFALMALLAAVAYLRRGRLAMLVLSCVALLAALLSKEAAIALFPLVAALWLVERVDHAQRWRILLFATGGVTAGWFVLRTMMVGSAPFSPTVFLHDAPIVGIGIAKTMLPIDMSPIATVRDTPLWLIVGGLTLAVLLIAPRSKQSWKATMFGIAWFVLFLIPTLGGSFERVPTVLECRYYLPMLGLLFAVAYGWSMNIGGALRTRQIAAVAVVVLLIAIAWRESAPYRSTEALCEQSLLEAPSSPSVHVEIGDFDLAADRLDEAAQHYRTALALDSEEISANAGLSAVFARRGVRDSADYYEQRETMLYGDEPLCWHNLAVRAAARGSLEEAMLLERRAVGVNERFGLGWASLATYALRGGYDADVRYAVSRLHALGDPVPPAVSAYLNGRH